MNLDSFVRTIDITLIRHGTTKFNEEDRVQGSSNIDLSQKGIDEIQLVDLENADFDIHYHSPLNRSRDTLVGILQKYNKDIQNLKIKEDILITERKYGIFEGMTKKEIKSKYPELYEEWMTNENIKGEGIETIENVIDRIKLFISKIISFNFKNVLIVTHSGFLYALYKYVTESELYLKPKDIEIGFPNCCVVYLNLKVSMVNIELKLNINGNLFQKNIKF